MKLKHGWLLFIFLWSCGLKASQPSNIIFITVDGVRHQEFILWQNLQRIIEKYDGVILSPYEKSQIVVANSVLYSQPAYQSIFLGQLNNCYFNGCGRVQDETFMEHIKEKLNLSFTDVAAFSSWGEIEDSLTQKEDAPFYINTGLRYLTCQEGDEICQLINTAEQNDLPLWSDARWDKYTFSHAMNYIQKYEPRLMYISFNDSDEWGHRNQYDNYLESIELYDIWLSDLVELLSTMGDYGQNTLIILTTDHGRGNDQDWHGHGSTYPESKDIWLAAFRLDGEKLDLFQDEKTYTHLDLRPAIEKYLLP